MHKFLIDESSGRKLFKFLSEKNYNVEYVGDVMCGADDLEILKYAENNKIILITNDKDFGELVFRMRRPSHGVIFLRLKNNIPFQRLKYLLYLFDNYSDKIEKNFIVVSESQIRIRSLK
jgi:predicted nuclease of predicted toxin-antitoxin system